MATVNFVATLVTPEQVSAMRRRAELEREHYVDLRDTAESLADVAFYRLMVDLLDAAIPQIGE